MAQPTAYEQYFLELVNRARLDPAGEAARFGMGLNDGLAAGTISATPKQPLAFNPALLDAADAHSAWMLATDTFSHTGANGSSPGDRMKAAGYSFAGSWSWGENIAIAWGSGVGITQAQIDSFESGLFLSAGHRANILNPRFDAAGVAILWKGVRVYVVENFVRKIPDISDNETASRIVEAYNRARRAAAIVSVAVKADLREAACSMAKKDRVSARDVGDLKARSIVAFTTFQPEELPKSLESRVAENYSRVSVGACFARTPSYPSGTNWVVMVFYP